MYSVPAENSWDVVSLLQHQKSIRYLKIKKASLSHAAAKTGAGDDVGVDPSTQTKYNAS